jgi:hypothetical protein
MIVSKMRTDPNLTIWAFRSRQIGRIPVSVGARAFLPRKIARGRSSLAYENDNSIHRFNLPFAWAT